MTIDSIYITSKYDKWMIKPKLNKLVLWHKNTKRKTSLYHPQSIYWKEDQSYHIIFQSIFDHDQYVLVHRITVDDIVQT